MDPSHLSLVTHEERVSGDRRSVVAPLVFGVALCAAAALATIAGADEARREVDPRTTADSTLQRALKHGSQDEEVRGELVNLRQTIGRRPLDTQTRVVYASLLLALSSRIEDLEVAAFHARIAAALSPVTVPVVQIASLVLASTGNHAEALELTRSMFDYDHAAASRLLLQSEYLFAQDELEVALGSSPEAWLAWAEELRAAGRVAESNAWIERAYEDWPDNLSVLEQAAARATAGADWPALQAMFPDDRVLPRTGAAAAVYLYRARAKLTTNDPAGARADVEEALRLRGDSPGILSLAGDTLRAIGDHAEARRLWTSALFSLDADDRVGRRGVLVRLAFLAEEDGEPGEALRLWRQILELDSEDPEARSGILRLTGSAN